MIRLLYTLVLISYTLYLLNIHLEGTCAESPSLKTSCRKEPCLIRKWNKNIVPYEFSEDINKELKSAIEDALVFWNNLFKGCIEFTERIKEKDYVTFTDGNVCLSNVGRATGKQLVVLDKNDCSSFGKIAHEIMHTIGFLHEHTRPDRDNYIKVFFENLPPDWQYEYDKTEGFYFGELGPYDYYSLMHYRVLGPDNHLPAFKIIRDNIDETKVGQQVNLTKIDIMKIRNMYCRESNSISKKRRTCIK